MKTEGTRLPSGMFVVASAWITTRFTPFYQSLSPGQRACFILSIFPLPVYLVDGQFFILLDIISVSISGEEVPFLPFIALLTETFLIIYSASLILIFQSSRGAKALVTRNVDPSQPHGCLITRYVPLHLYNEEKKPSNVDDTEFIKGFVGLNSDEQILIDRLPQALEILQNNASMLDIYSKYHSEPERGNALETKSKSLLDILKEASHPEITSESDVDRILKS